MWLKKNQPELYERADLFVLDQERILHKLGVEGYYEDWSNGSMYGLMDINKFEWDLELTKKLGINPKKLPKLVPSGKILGEVPPSVSYLTGFAEGTLLVSGGGDQQCAGIGAGAIKSGVIEVAMGTSGVTLGYMDKPNMDPTMEMPCSAHTIAGKWESEGLQNAAAASYKWFRNEFAYQENLVAQEKGMSVYHKQSGKMVKLAQPQQFLAQERTIVEKAYPGDIIGVFDPGIFGIGDSLSDASQKLQFEDFPVFPPEIFARVQPKDSLKRKQFEKGIIQLSQEGAIQVFRQEGVGLESYIVGVVGVLQLEVLEYRLLNEYSSVLLMNQLPYSVARWVYAEDKKLIDNIKGLDNGMLVYDKKDRPVILVNNEWSLNWILDRNPGIQFLTVPADVEKI